MSATSHVNTRYGIAKSVPLPYEEAVERTRAALQKEGFGVLTEIDVKATLRSSSGRSRRSEGRQTLAVATAPTMSV